VREVSAAEVDAAHFPAQVILRNLDYAYNQLRSEISDRL
jgi:hypothetical protein